MLENDEGQLTDKLQKQEQMYQQENLIRTMSREEFRRIIRMS